MPDYGMLSSGLSSFHPLARNPWKLDRNPGGSSAGAGAAGAALYGPLHLGTDIGGSVRLPAGWCGLVGLKPSAGRVPIDPPYVGRVAGPMTRDAADAALMMATLALPDERDYSSLKYEKLDWAIEPAPLKGLKLGLMLEAGCGVAAHGRGQGRGRAGRARLRDRGRACRAAEALPDPGDAGRSRPLLARPGAERHRRLPPERRAVVLPFIRQWAELAAGFSGVEVFRGFDQIPEMRKAAVASTDRFDFVLSPTAPMTAFPAEWASPSQDPLKPFPHIGFTVAYNMSEQPAATVNCGYDGEGLPIGLQIVGRRFDDVGVFVYRPRLRGDAGRGGETMARAAASVTLPAADRGKRAARVASPEPWRWWRPRPFSLRRARAPRTAAMVRRGSASGSTPSSRWRRETASRLGAQRRSRRRIV